MSQGLPRTIAPEPRGRSQPAWRRRLPDWLPLAAVAVVILSAAPLVVWACQVVHPTPLIHEMALFVHLGALVLGLGGALSVDWVAGLYILGKRSFLELLRAADNAAAPIWGGYAGLVLSGLFLEPALNSPFTMLKLALVLVVGLNGVVALGVQRALAREADLRWMAIGGSAAVISQLGWWGATIIGFIHAH